MAAGESSTAPHEATPHEATPHEAAPHVAVIGAGAVGTALGGGVATCGYAVRAIISRKAGDARRLAKHVGAPVASAAPADLPPGLPLVFCCVPDDEIAPVAEALAALGRDWSASVVAHTSGAQPARLLAPLAARGASVMSFHPAQAFTRRTGPEAFQGICIGLEGDARALATGREVAERLGARPVVIPEGAKARYHLAAALASNALVTLVALAHEVLASAGIEAADRQALLGPLVEGTARSLARQPPEEALTGPVARGERGTVGAHADALAANLPHLQPFYAALTTETVRLAVRSGRLAPPAAEDLLGVLRAALDPSTSHTNSEWGCPDK